MPRFEQAKPALAGRNKQDIVNFKLKLYMIYSVEVARYQLFDEIGREKSFILLYIAKYLSAAKFHFGSKINVIRLNLDL